MDDFMEKLLQEVSQDTNNLGMGQPVPLQQQTSQGYAGPQSLPNTQQPGMPGAGSQNRYQPIQVQQMPQQPMPQPQPMPQQPMPQPQPMPQQPMPQPQPMQQSQPQPMPHMGQMQPRPVMPQPMPQAPNVQPQYNSPRPAPAPAENNMQRQGGLRAINAVSFEDVSYLPDADNRSAYRPLPGVEELAMEARRTEAYEEKFRNNANTSARTQENNAPEAPAMEFNSEKIMEEVQSIVHTEVVKCYKNTEAAIGEASENIKGSIGEITSPKKVFAVIITLLIINLLMNIAMILHSFFGLI